MTAPIRRQELIWRSVSAGCALVCLACLWVVSHRIWTGLTTGRIRARYGWTLRDERPIMFDITVGLNVMAALVWVALAALAIWFACSRTLYRD